ncbi:MAG: TonB family protein [candidate division WOR-3 bacterium]
MMKRECMDCSELLGPYLDAELDDMRRHRVAAHLETCPECRRELAALEALHRLVREKDTGPTLADDYWDWHRFQVWKRIRTGRRPERQPAARHGLYLSRLGIVAAGVVVVLVVVVGGWRLVQIQTSTRHVEPTGVLGNVEDEAYFGGKQGQPFSKKERMATEDSGEEGRVLATAKPQLPPAQTSADREGLLETESKGSAGKPGPGLGGVVAAGEAEAARTGSADAAPAGRGAATGLTKPLGSGMAEAGSWADVPLSECEQAPVLVEIDDLPFVEPEDTATVLLRALVEPDGSVSRVEISRSSGVRLLDTIALYNVQRARFAPGIQHDRKVRCWVEVIRTFEPEAKPEKRDIPSENTGK